MKKHLLALMMLWVSSTAFATPELDSGQALLEKMSHASQHLNYELSYILVKKNSIEPLLYRHAREKNDQQLAHLVYLSGPVREVIRRGDEVSYVEPGIEPFTILSGAMVAPIIPLLNSNITQLSQHYDFVRMGRAREAGVACQVLRVVPKDGLRYSYMLWIDEHSLLPLRADLVDRDGEVLEQYRTISYRLNDQLVELMSGLNKVQLPEVLALPQGQLQSTYWEATWVPDGFQALELNRYRMAMTERLVENQLFSDGLFSFAIYVSEHDNQSLKGQLIRQGRRTVHTLIKGKNEIYVVGDIPPATAQRIAQSVEIDSSRGNTP